MIVPPDLAGTGPGSDQEWNVVAELIGPGRLRLIGWQPTPTQTSTPATDNETQNVDDDNADGDS
jgi:hypothetical protein